MITETHIDIGLRALREVFESRNKALKLHFYQDFERGILRALAQSKPLEPFYFLEQTLVVSPAPWTYSFWARLVRKVTSWKWFRDWCYPLQCFAGAQQVTHHGTVRTIDVSALSEIQGQIHRLQLLGYEPYSILLGKEALNIALTDFQTAYDFRPQLSPVCHTTTIFGIPVYSYPFLHPNTILVVPCHDKTR